jgi:hypothetical protein
MLTCGKCGTENQLGRIFCGGCGSKLDMSGMSAEAVASQPARRRSSGSGCSFGVILLIVLIVVVGVAVACLLPSREPIGEMGTKLAKRKIQQALRVFKNLGARRSMGRSFKEADINGYLEHEAAQRMEVMNCSVDVRQGSLDVRMNQLLKRIRVGSFSVDLILTFEVTYQEQEGKLQLTGGRIGKMPLVNRLAVLSAKPIEARITGLKEWEAFRYVESVRADANALHVKVRR